MNPDFGLALAYFIEEEDWNNPRGIGGEPVPLTQLM